MTSIRLAAYTHGSHAIGLGHLYRVKRLMEACAERMGTIRSTVLLADSDRGARQTLREWGLDVIDVPRDDPDHLRVLASELSAMNADVVVHDALDSDLAVMKVLRDTSCHLVTLDDSSPSAELADMAINVLYPIDGPTARRQRSAPADYLLPQPFEQAATESFEVREEIDRILVTQGGADTWGNVPRIAQALETIDPAVDIVLLAGPASRNVADIHRVVAEARRPFTVIEQQDDMVGLMRSCDLAVSGGGGTLFELAAIGVPTIAITGEEKETHTITRLARLGMIIDVGLTPPFPSSDLLATVTALAESVERRKALSDEARRHVDGRGMARFLDWLGSRHAVLTEAD